MKSYHELIGERKALLSEARRAGSSALRNYFQGQVNAFDARLAELRRVGKPQPMRTRNGDVFANGKWEKL